MVFIIIPCIFFYLLIPTLPTQEDPIVFYSNQTKNDLRSTLLKAMSKAQKSIYMVMFGLSDSSIISMIKKKKSENLNINVFYDKRSSQYYLPKDIFYGIKQSGGLLHQKLICIDDEIVFIGSANMTRSSLSMHDNLVIGIYDSDLTNFVKTNAPFNSGRISLYVGSQLLDFFLLPDKHNQALNKLIEMVQSAQSSLYLVMFNLTHPILIEEIIKAYKRDLDVKVIVDFQSSKGCASKFIEKMKKAGVCVQINNGPQLMHHKYLYIDNKTLITGSTNWTKAAFKRNKDCLLIVNNLTDKQRLFMKKLNKVLLLESK